MFGSVSPIINVADSFSIRSCVRMTRDKVRILFLVMLMLPLNTASAQKVKVGYDKSTDFSRFATYTWAEPAMPPVRRAMFASIVWRVDEQLQWKGFTKTSSNGDLTLIPAGGVEFGLSGGGVTPILPTYGGPPPAFNSTMWTGAGGASTARTYVPEGTLVLTFVERATNTVVWAGSVEQKLDAERQLKSAELVDKAVIKLVKQFPTKEELNTIPRVRPLACKL